MKTRTKLLTCIIAIMLSCVIILMPLCISFGTKDVCVASASVRTVDLSGSNVDDKSVFDEFENYVFVDKGLTTSFEGYKTFNENELREIDYIVNDELDEQTSYRFKYNVSYDAESNIVTIKVEAQNADDNIDVCEVKGVAFVNTDGEIDARMDIDGETILLSGLYQTSFINNCGWLSRLIKTVASIIVSPIAVVVVHIVEESYAISNYNHNKGLDNDVEEFINGQGREPYCKYKFGTKYMFENGCGSIATYNVMRLLKNQNKITSMPNLSEITYDIERLSGTLLLGQFGEDPTSIKEYFSRKGISSKSYTNHNNFDNALNNMRDTQHAILCFWTDKNQIPGNAHYVTVTNNQDGNGRYKIYNNENHDTDVVYKENLNEILDGGAIITGIIIN